MEVFNFWDIDWGADEAKGDRDLKYYFVEIPEYDSIKEGKCRYIVGRKGAGKTAICERIKIDAESDPLSFSSSLTLRNFPLPSIRNLRNKSFRDKSQFVPIWSFLILIELCKLIIKDDNGAQPGEIIEELNKFLITNSLINDIGFIETIDFLNKSSAKVRVATGWVEGGREQSKSTITSVHFEKITSILRDKLLKINSESSFYLFMDELDEGYSAGDNRLRLILLALLRATEDLAIYFQHSNLKFRPIVALRSDIFDRLEDNDLNKLDDYTVRINWRSIDTPTYCLKSIPNARITNSLKGLINADPWGNVVNETGLPRKINSAWSYIANNTFERPRDIIKFMKCCRKQNGTGRLNFSLIKKAEVEYSKWFYNELRDEIHTHLSIWKESLGCITKIGKGRFETSQFFDELKKDKNISNWIKNNNKSLEEIANILFDFGVLGNFDGKRWLFKYKDDDLSWNPNMSIIVHFGFKNKLKLLSR